MRGSMPNRSGATTIATRRHSSRSDSAAATAPFIARCGARNDTHRQAFRYVEDQIAQLMQGLPPSLERSHVVDLGCGVGASLCYLAARCLSGTGITLSPVQARLAERRIRESGLSDRIRCVEGDYCDLPIDIGPADLAYAIESFVHVQDPARFFAQCAASFGRAACW